MPHRLRPFTSCAFAMLVCGCTPHGDQARTAPETFNQVSKEAPVPMPAASATAAALVPSPMAPVREFAYSEKAEFVKQYRDQVAAISGDLQRVSARIDQADAATQEVERPQLKLLRDQAAALNRRLDKATDATEASWAETKTGVRTAFGELQAGAIASRQWGSAKSAP